jgi:hypothetical protein
MAMAWTGVDWMVYLLGVGVAAGLGWVAGYRKGKEHATVAGNTFWPRYIVRYYAENPEAPARPEYHQAFETWRKSRTPWVYQAALDEATGIYIADTLVAMEQMKHWLRPPRPDAGGA